MIKTGGGWAVREVHSEEVAFEHEGKGQAMQTSGAKCLGPREEHRLPKLHGTSAAEAGGGGTLATPGRRKSHSSHCHGNLLKEKVVALCLSPRSP